MDQNYGIPMQISALFNLVRVQRQTEVAPQCGFSSLKMIGS